MTVYTYPPRRRVKIFHVDEQALLTILGCWRNGQFIQLPTSPQIPEGCKIIRVWHRHEARALAVMLEHPSFEEVPDGEEAPRGQPFIEMECLEKIPVADHFRQPIHDPSRICLNCQWFYQSVHIRRFQIDNPRKMCKGECRYAQQFAADGVERLPFLSVFADSYCGAFLRLEYPKPYPSPFPPPKITALERWLTVANIEKYTVASPASPANWQGPGDPRADIERIVGMYLQGE